MFVRNRVNFLVCLIMFLAALIMTESLTFAAPSKTVVVLFDVSESTKDPAVRGKFLSDFDKVILKKVNPGDVIAADRIAESSAAGSTLPVNHEFEGEWSSNRLKQLKQKKEIYKEAESILSNKGKVKYTDILSSLLISERVFKSYGKERNVLVIMSDMIEDSKNYNFTRERLTDKRIATIIAKERKGGRLPDLKGVTVYAVKSVTCQAGEDYNGIRNFWIRYLTECGARIGVAQYGPLTKFE